MAVFDKQEIENKYFGRVFPLRIQTNKRVIDMINKWIVGLLVGFFGFSSFGGEFDGEFNIPEYTHGTYKEEAVLKATALNLSGSDITFRVKKTDPGAFSKRGLMKVRRGSPTGDQEVSKPYNSGVDSVTLSFDLDSSFNKGQKRDYYCTSKSTDGDEYDVGPISVYRRVDTPSRPTVTSTSSSSISLSWSTVSGATKYVLYKKVSGGNYSGSYVSGTSKVVTGLDPDTTYYFKLKAQGSGGNETRSESYSSERSARTSSETVTCAIPSSCSVPSSDSDGAYTVNWGASSTAGASYRLEERKNSGSWSYVTSGTSRNRNITGKSSGTYTYRVKATKSGCTDSGWRTSGGCVVSISSVVATPSSCSVPSSDSDGVYTVNWDASSTGGASYRLEERKNSGSWSYVTSGTSRSCSITGKSDGTYTYRVKATKSGYTDSSWRNSGGCVVSIASSDTTPPTFNSVNLDGHSDGGAISIEVNERLNFSGTISDNVSLEKVSMVVSRAGESVTNVFSSSPSNPYSLSSNYFQPTAGGHYIVGLWGKDTSDNTDRYAWSVEVKDSSAPAPVDTLYGVNADPHEKWRRFSGITQTALLGGNASHNLTPAELIYYSAKENDINPVLLIAKLQDEMGLIKTIYSDVVLAKKMKRATGYGCLDGGDLDSWYGFYPQLVSCTYQFSLSRTRGMSFQEAYESYTTGSGKYSGFVSGIYNWVAAEMNTIARTSFDTTPTSGSGTGYYNDFKEVVTIAHIQSLLEQHVGRLKNESLFSSTSSGGTPPVQTGQPVFFSQKNSTWAENQLGHGRLTLGSHGCLVTCISMMYNNLIGISNPPNPAEMNSWLEANNGFDIDEVYWNKSDDHPAGGLSKGAENSLDNNWVGLRNSLVNGDWCVLEVVNSKLMHFVLAYAYTGGDVNEPSSYRILDPIEDSFNPNLTMAKYRTFFRRTPYSGNFSQGGVTPPEIISPEANEVGVPLAVACSWLSGIEGASFRVQIATGVSRPSWSSVNGFTTSTSSSTAVPLNIGLPMQDTHAFMWTNSISGQRNPRPETDYWMSVKIFQPEVGSTYSTPVHFKTTIAAPSVTAPANNATLTSSPIQASWTTISGVTASRIQIAEDKSEWTKAYGFTLESDPSDRVVVNANTGSAKTYSWQSGSPGSHQGPESGKSYYLTVRSYKPNAGSSTYSEPIQFTYQTGSVSYPSAQTLAASQIGTTSVRLNGDVTSDGGSAITSRGFFLSENATVSSGDTRFNVSGSVGEFSYVASGLNPDTQYWYRSFAFNDEGGVYGLSTQTFTTRDVTAPTYTLVVNSGTGDGTSYTEGQVVSISANTPPSGKVFDRWIGDTSAIASVTASSTTVVMPAQNITVSSTYRDSGGGTEENDSFADAIRLTGNSGQTTGSTIGATKETGEPAHAGTTGAASIWWTWVPTVNTHIEVDTVGSDFDTVLAVYTGGSVGSLTEIVSNDDVSSSNPLSAVGFDAVQGETYRIAVAGYSEYRGAVVLNWATSSATTYTLVVNSGTGDGTSYTEGQVVSISADAPPSGKVFDRWTGDTSAIATVTASSTTITIPSANVTVSATYKDSGGGTEVNDSFADAIRLTGNSGQTTGSTTDATKESGEPAHAGKTGVASIWWTWVPAANTHVTFDTIGSDFDTVLAVYTGSSVAGLTEIVSADDGSGVDYTSKVEFDAVQGVTYCIAVDGYNEVRKGSVVLNWATSSATTYALVVNNGTGDGTSYTAGQRISISANTPPSGKVFDRWTGDTSTMTNVTASSMIFVMPDRNATISATYRDVTAPTYILVVNGGTGDGTSYTEGQVISISADAPPSGKVFDRWTGDTSAMTNLTESSTIYFMPGRNATITATYKDAGGGSRHFEEVSGNPADPLWDVYLAGATVDGSTLGAGDEIAVYDGSTLVGSFVLTGTLTDAQKFNNTLKAFSTLDSGLGYQAGNSYQFRCWDASAGIERSGTVSWSNPSGDAYTGTVFPSAQSPYSIATLTFVTTHFPEVSGNPADPTWDIYLAGATLNGSDLEAGDEIAIYDGATLVGSFSLSDILTDAQKFNNTLKAFSTLSSGAGYQAGHAYRFVCWDQSASQEHSGSVQMTSGYTDATFPSGDGEYSIATLLFGMRTQEVSLRSGYQFVSLNVTPDPAGMLTVLSDVQDNLSIVKDSNANTIRKIGSSWINGIGDWASSEGYLIKMNASGTLSVTGVPVPGDTPISLETGYQFITYLPSEPQDALIVLADVLDNLSIVKDSNANTIRKIGDTWINGIGDMVPSEGYLVKMSGADTLRYSSQAQGASIAMENAPFEALDDEPKDARHFPEVSGNPADSTWDIYLEGAAVNSVDLEAGDELAIYDGVTLVGSFVLSEKLTEARRYQNVLKAFSTLDDENGYTAGNSYSVKIWDASGASEHDATVELLVADDAYAGAGFPTDKSPYSIMTVTAEGGASGDLDGDGLPDAWEAKFPGGDFVPSALCANGINTVREAYIAGLDPTDPSSTFLTSILPGNSLHWSTITGRVYSVWWTTNLLENFQPLETNLPWTQNGYTNSNPGSCDYYKIKIELK